MAEADLADIASALKNALTVADRDGINRAARELLRRHAPMGESWKAIANALIQIGEYSAAVDAGRQYVIYRSHHPAALYGHATLLAQAGRVGEAEEILKTLADDVPTVTANAYTRGIIALNLGHAEAASDHLHRAVSADPTSGPAWLALAMATKSPTDSLLKLFHNAEAGMRSVRAADRAQFDYGLGKLLTMAGDHSRAFHVISRAAGEWRKIAKPDMGMDDRSASEAIRGFDREELARLSKRVVDDTSRPIIVTGSPRAGTTLVEQILVSHSEVSGGDEVGRFGRLAREAGGCSASAIARISDGHGRLNAIAAQYLHLLNERFGHAGRVVDKSPDASRYLGALAASLPEARIVWIVRDPIDCAWSCFRHFFLRGASWSYDLEDIAHHFSNEAGLLAKWREILEDKLLVVNYESLAQNPVEQIEIILRHCGLSLEIQSFNPHLTERIITTASGLQVREPITTSSIGISEPYRQYLMPFISNYIRATGQKV